MEDYKIEQFLQKFGDEDGNVSDELMSKFLAGEVDLEEKKDENPESGAVESSATEEQEPVVLAKDGIHTIPYSRIEELQSKVEQFRLDAEKSKQIAAKHESELEELRAALESKNEILAKMQDAQQSDTQTGTTEAMDALMADLSDDYPGAAKLISSLLKQVQDITKEVQVTRAERDEERARKSALTAAEKAQIEFNEAAMGFEPKYLETISKDEFWKWFDEQPAYVRAVQKISDPQASAEVVTAFLKHTASASDSAQPGAAPLDKEKLKESLAKAKTPAVKSLSDVPGGSNPATDELEAIAEMSAVDMAHRFIGKAAADVERILSRIV